MKPSSSSSSSSSTHLRLHLLVLVLVLVLVLFVAAAEGDTTPTIVDTICGRNQSQDAEAFDVNFVNTMELIYQNITESGFGAAVSGAANTVYGLGQCFGYLAPTSCQICYAQSRLKLPHCLPATDSRIYLDGCFLRYADRNVSADATDAYDTAVCGNASTNSSAFNDAATRLVANLTAAALNQTDFYQAGSANVAADVSVYGMAQCWRSLNASGCRECLESAGASAVKCLPASDGKALNAGCFVRYSTEPFYLAASSSGGGSSGISSSSSSSSSSSFPFFFFF